MPRALADVKVIHKLDFPAFDWPVVPFPANRFPLAEHAEANAALEARVLSEVEDVFVREGGNVAGLIVEPIHRRDLVLLDGIERVVER